MLWPRWTLAPAPAAAPGASPAPTPRGQRLEKRPLPPSPCSPGTGPCNGDGAGHGAGAGHRNGGDSGAGGDGDAGGDAGGDGDGAHDGDGDTKLRFGVTPGLTAHGSGSISPATPPGFPPSQQPRQLPRWHRSRQRAAAPRRCSAPPGATEGTCERLQSTATPPAPPKLLPDPHPWARSHQPAPLLVGSLTTTTATATATAHGRPCSAQGPAALRRGEGDGFGSSVGDAGGVPAAPRPLHAADGGADGGDLGAAPGPAPA